MTVIMPPSAKDMASVFALLEAASNPAAMKQALEQLRDATNVHAAELATSRAAQRAAADAERRARELMTEVETKTARLDARAKALDEREAALLAREARLAAIRRQIA